MQVLADNLTLKQQKTDSDFAAMAQLMQQSAAHLQVAVAKMESMQYQVAASRRSREIASLSWQISRLSQSAQDLNREMRQIEARAKAMKDFQENLLRFPFPAEDALSSAEPTLSLRDNNQQDRRASARHPK